MFWPKIGNTVIKIGLDAGHGGLDSGAVSGDFKESDFNFLICEKIQNILFCITPKIECIILRNENEDPSFDERANRAENCDLIISLHTNASYPSSHGVLAFHWPTNKIGEDISNTILRCYPHLPIIRPQKTQLLIVSCHIVRQILPTISTAFIWKTMQTNHKSVDHS